MNRDGAPPDWAPGELGRLALYTDPIVVAAQLRGWCAPDTERYRVAEWFHAIAVELEGDG
jgi:hypothetical protein